MLKASGGIWKRRGAVTPATTRDIASGWLWSMLVELAPLPMLVAALVICTKACPAPLARDKAPTRGESPRVVQEAFVAVQRCIARVARAGQPDLQAVGALNRVEEEGPTSSREHSRSAVS